MRKLGTMFEICSDGIDLPTPHDYAHHEPALCTETRPVQPRDTEPWRGAHMEVKRQQHRTRIKGVEAATGQELEVDLNIALAELEEAGQDILSVQIFPVAHTAGSFTAFIIYTDNVGLDVDFTQRHVERHQEKSRKEQAQHQRVSERRAQQETAPMASPSAPVSTPGS